MGGDDNACFLHVVERVGNNDYFQGIPTSSVVLVTE